ncbi:MAG TPA: M23 family metallopeptidase [Thermoanaerobaculia bacterium]|nr:M23 family metallopeptidase [Thermoanaerobaculia bacterium]
MEFQFHPASRQAAVRTVVIGPRGERVTIAGAGLAALLAVSAWITVPAVASRIVRSEHSASIAGASAAVNKDYRDVAARAAGMRERALDGGDFVSRAAFLYGVAPSAWPRSLNPEAGLLATADPERLVRALGRYATGLERGLALVADREAADPTLAGATPSILPLASDLVEPAVRFGPRVSPWTGTEEFFAGMDLAAPAGAPVIAPAAGMVAFAGRVPASVNSRLWRFGNLVVVSHGPSGATVFGHLARVEVRRGERVRRGQRLGTVGASGWTTSPGLHYELWRPGPEGLAPTDPRFAMLDLRLPGHDVSLEKMRATSAPGPQEPLPGLR